MALPAARGQPYRVSAEVTREEDENMNAKKIGIVGKGNVGSALERGLTRAGHLVKTVGKDPAAVRQVGDWAQVIILAVPFAAIDDALKELGGAADGKPLIDVTNAVNPQMQLAVGFTTSAAEEIQKKAPKTRVVKAFNTIFAQLMDSGKLGDQKLSVFVASDDAGARTEALALASDIGFDPVDAGPLKNARLIEPLGMLNIQLGYVQKLGQNIGIRLARG
jgi:8-hydroxy-5-deazaflavin:NADPH oxidoreductase